MKILVNNEIEITRHEVFEMGSAQTLHIDPTHKPSSTAPEQPRIFITNDHGGRTSFCMNIVAFDANSPEITLRIGNRSVTIGQ